MPIKTPTTPVTVAILAPAYMIPAKEERKDDGDQD